MRITQAGAFSEGNRVKPVRDLSKYRNKIIKSLFDEEFPVLGESYLVEEVYDLIGIPPDVDIEIRSKRMQFVHPSKLHYRIKLYGFEMGTDKHGFPCFFNAKDFMPESYKL